MPELINQSNLVSSIPKYTLKAYFGVCSCNGIYRVDYLKIATYSLQMFSGQMQVYSNLNKAVHIIPKGDLFGSGMT